MSSAQLGWTRAIIVVAMLLAVGSWSRAEESTLAPPTGPQAEARALALRRVSDELICQCGCNMILSECSHQSCPFALPERKRILASLAEGKSEQDIVKQYFQDYGRSILSTPPTNGGFLDRAAWAAPVLALLLGGVVAWRVARHYSRLRSLPMATDPATTRDPYLDRVERELGGAGR